MNTVVEPSNFLKIIDNIDKSQVCLHIYPTSSKGSTPLGTSLLTEPIVRFSRNRNFSN